MEAMGACLSPASPSRSGQDQMEEMGATVDTLFSQVTTNILVIADNLYRVVYKKSFGDEAVALFTCTI